MCKHCNPPTERPGSVQRRIKGEEQMWCLAAVKDVAFSARTKVMQLDGKKIVGQRARHISEVSS